MQLQHKVIIDPAGSKEVSLGRKNWCREIVGSPGVEWHVGWIAIGEPLDVYSFVKEEDATMFRLRWM